MGFWDSCYGLHSPKSITRPPRILCWMINLCMLSLSILYNNDKLNNQAWMRDWHSLLWLLLECLVNNTGLVDWLILVCWSNKGEVRIVVFHARRVPRMLTEHLYPCAPLNDGWIYEWMATFSTFDPVFSWLHFWESVVFSGKLQENLFFFLKSKIFSPLKKSWFKMQFFKTTVDLRMEIQPAL